MTKKDKEELIKQIEKADKLIIISISKENGKEMMNHAFYNIKDYEKIGLLELLLMELKNKI